MTNKVTELEMAVMMNIAQNEYNTCNGGKPESAEDTATWTNCIADCGRGPIPSPKGKTLSGVVSSLNKKGLVWSDSTGSSEDSTGLSDEGFELWKVLIEEYEKGTSSEVSAEPMEEVIEDPKMVLMNYLIEVGKEIRNAVEFEKVSDEALVGFIQLKMAKGNLPEAVWDALKK